MDFNQQKKLAKANYINKKFKNEGYNRSYNAGNSSVSSFKRTVNDKSFSDFADKAYKAKRGYAVRINPKTGEKEMFVRGTTFKRGGVEWAQNVLETPLSSMVGLGTTIAGDISRHIRGKYSKFLTDVAKREKVKVVYGHSRGAAVVNDMKIPGVRKYGLDGATILNRYPTITNYRQKQGFDALIGANARVTIKESRWTPIYSKRYHRVYSK